MNNKLSDGAEALGFPLSDEEMRLFGLYIEELLKWNAKVNLTAITEPDEIIIKHFLDSLALLRILPDFGQGPPPAKAHGHAARMAPPRPAPVSRTDTGQAAQKFQKAGRDHDAGLDVLARRGSQASGACIPETSGSDSSRTAPVGLTFGRFTACDIGSGAGFPGLALKIVLPEMDIALVEPARKKAAFLRHVIRTLGLSGARVMEARVEGLKNPSFDMAFSRAFKSLGELLKLAAPILKDRGRPTGGGCVAQSLSLQDAEALNRNLPGWEIAREEEITLPFSDIRRRLILLQKK